MAVAGATTSTEAAAGARQRNFMMIPRDMPDPTCGPQGLIRSSDGGRVNVAENRSTVSSPGAPIALADDCGRGAYTAGFGKSSAIRGRVE